MQGKLSRRDFIKFASLGAAASAAVHISGNSWTGMNALGLKEISGPVLALQEGVIATTCTNCELNCGLLITVENGRIQGVAGNPEHPVNRGMVCAGAEEITRDYLNTKRTTGPLTQTRRGSGVYSPFSWLDAEKIIEQVLCHTPASETVFITTSYSDHLNDYLDQLSAAIGGLKMISLVEPESGDSSMRLRQASQKVFGNSQVPYFDTEHAELILTFGLEGTEPWLSSLAKLRYRAQNVQRNSQVNQTWMHFSSNKPDADGLPGEWIKVLEGCETRLVSALTRLESASRPIALPDEFDLAVEAIFQMTSLSYVEVAHLVERFTAKARKIAIPGRTVLSRSGGFEAAEAILKLNIAADNLGKPGGLFFVAPAPVYPYHRQNISSSGDLQFLIERMKQGWIKTVLMHGNRQLSQMGVLEELEEALDYVPRVISFSPYADAFTRCADYIFPDHHSFESWGYQKITQGSDRVVVSAIQPVFVPGLDSRATLDVLTSAVQRAGGSLAAALSFGSENSFLQQTLVNIHDHSDIPGQVGQKGIWSSFYQRGGWWPATAVSIPPVYIG